MQGRTGEICRFVGSRVGTRESSRELGSKRCAYRDCCWFSFIGHSILVFSKRQLKSNARTKFNYQTRLFDPAASFSAAHSCRST